MPWRPFLDPAQIRPRGSAGGRRVVRGGRIPGQVVDGPRRFRGLPDRPHWPPGSLVAGERVSRLVRRRGGAALVGRGPDAFRFSRLPEKRMGGGIGLQRCDVRELGPAVVEAAGIHRLCRNSLRRRRRQVSRLPGTLVCSCGGRGCRVRDAQRGSRTIRRRPHRDLLLDRVRNLAGDTVAAGPAVAAGLRRCCARRSRHPPGPAHPQRRCDRKCETCEGRGGDPFQPLQAGGNDRSSAFWDGAHLPAGTCDPLEVEGALRGHRSVGGRGRLGLRSRLVAASRLPELLRLHGAAGCSQRGGGRQPFGA